MSSYLLSVRCVRSVGAAALVVLVVLGATAGASSAKSGAAGENPSGQASGGASASGGSSTSSTSSTSPTSSTGTTGSTRKGTAVSGKSRKLGSRVLHIGMQGADVRILQGDLTRAGFPTQADGAFGPLTRQSVIDFEEAHALTPNGVVNKAVVKALRAAVSTYDSADPTGTTTINPNGTATAPADAPPAVKAIVAAANKIIDTSYCVGGGHGAWQSSCYDCSGSVSFALHGAGLLSSPLDSTGFESYGDPGPGQWVTIYTDPGHAFLVVAGRAFDTADYGGPNIPDGTGPRWRTDPLGNLADGGDYVARHPAGL